MPYYYTEELYHHGILGQKWGVRHFQNKDGSLTEAGRRRYQKSEFKLAQKTQSVGYKSDYDRMEEYKRKSKVIQERSKELKDLSNKAMDLYFDIEEYEDKPKVRETAENKARKLMQKDPTYDPELEEDFMDYYLYDKGVLSKTRDEMFSKDPNYNKLKSSYDKIVNDYKEKTYQITNDIIGEYGNTKIKGLGTDMNYGELVAYSLTSGNTIPTFTFEDYVGRK